ncbi:MAG: aromatic ring-hydroxylating dioxygenase subunit alpha, partial [Actinomycetota bacterium]
MSGSANWDGLLRLFWHPVCRVTDVVDGAEVLPARLLGQDLAVARLGPERWAAYIDRCPHRSTRLSVGSVDGGGLRCAYHGWRFDAAGRCDDIPSLPDSPIPSAACATSFRAEERHGLVWVLLDDRLDPPIPACPMADDPDLRVLTPDPYTWPVGPPRRVENFVDLAHFAFVHDGSLGRRDEPVPPVPEIERVEVPGGPAAGAQPGGELRFVYHPPELDPDPSAMFGASAYRMPMPLTVNIEFFMDGGVRRMLWMTASPVELGVSRCFWMMGRNDELDPSFDDAHLAFQQQVLDEDEPVVCNQVPPELDLNPGV